MSTFNENDPEKFDESVEIEESEEFLTTIDGLINFLVEAGFDDDSNTSEENDEAEMSEEEIEKEWNDIVSSLNEIEGYLGDLGDINTDSLDLSLEEIVAQFSELPFEVPEPKHPVIIEELLPRIEEMLQRLRRHPRRWEKLAENKDFLQEFALLCNECAIVSRDRVCHFDLLTWNPSPVYWSFDRPLTAAEVALKNIKYFVDYVEPTITWIHESIKRRAQVSNYLREQYDLHLQARQIDPNLELLSQFQKSSGDEQVTEFEKFDRWLTLGLWQPLRDVRRLWSAMKLQLLRFGARKSWNRAEWLEGLAWYYYFISEVLDGFNPHSFQCTLPLLRSFIYNYLSFEQGTPTLLDLQSLQVNIVRDVFQLRQRNSELTNIYSEGTSERYCVWVPNRGLVQQPSYKTEQDGSQNGYLFEVEPSLLFLTLRGLLNASHSDFELAQPCSLQTARTKALIRGDALIILSEELHFIRDIRINNTKNNEQIGLSRVLFIHKKRKSLLPKWKSKRDSQKGELVPQSIIHPSDCDRGLEDIGRFLAYLQYFDSNIPMRFELAQLSDNELDQGIRLFEAARERKKVIRLLEEKKNRGDRNSELLLSLLEGQLRSAYKQAKEFAETSQQDGRYEDTIYWSSVSHLMSSFGMLSGAGNRTAFTNTLQDLSRKMLEASQSIESQAGWRAFELVRLLQVGQPLERLFHDLRSSYRDLKDLADDLQKIGYRRDRKNLFAELLTAIQHWSKVKQIEESDRCTEAKARKLYIESLTDAEREKVNFYFERDILDEHDPRFYLTTEDVRKHFNDEEIKVQEGTERFALPWKFGHELLRLWRANIQKHTDQAKHMAQLSQGVNGSLRLMMTDRGPGFTAAGLDLLRNRHSSFSKLLLESGWCSRVLLLSISSLREPQEKVLLGDFTNAEIKAVFDLLPYERGSTFVVEFPCDLNGEAAWKTGVYS